MLSTFDVLSRLLCPEFLRGPAQRLKYHLRVRLNRLRVVASVEEFDRAIAHVDFQQADEHMGLLNRLHLDGRWPLPADPESEEYRRAVMETYYQVSGRKAYESAENEWVPEAGSEERPHPYSTGSAEMVGEHLMAVGFLFRAMALAPGMSVLEFGPGSGNTTIELARFGANVTAVDVNPNYLALINRRCRGLAGNVETVQADMLDFRSEKRFDRILFFQCFHHCSDPMRMLDQLEQRLAPGGTVVFAGEPITDGFPVPWGLRTDGLSAYCIRKFGWLELGFNARFFKKLLHRRGWSLSFLQSLDMPRIHIYLARRSSSRGAGSQPA